MNFEQFKQIKPGTLCKDDLGIIIFLKIEETKNPETMKVIYFSSNLLQTDYFVEIQSYLQTFKILVEL